MEFLRAIFLDPERRLRTVWRFLIYGVGFVVVAVAVQILVVVGLIAFFFVSDALGAPDKSGSSDRNLAGWLQMLTTEQMWLLMALATPPSTIALFALTILCRLFLDRRSFASMGYVWPGNGPLSAAWAGLIWGIVPILAAICLPWLLKGYQLESMGLPLQAIVLTPTLVLAAWQEEFVFRGYLLQNLLDLRRPVFGVLFSSLVFWIVHGFNPNAWSSPLIGLNLFGAGVLLALAYMASGNIWFPTAMHFGWNFAQGVLLSVPISGIQTEGILTLRLTGTLPAWLTGGKFGLEGSILVTLFELVFIGLFLAVLRSRQTATVPPPAEAEIVSAELSLPVEVPPEVV